MRVEVRTDGEMRLLLGRTHTLFFLFIQSASNVRPPATAIATRQVTALIPIHALASYQLTKNKSREKSSLATAQSTTNLRTGVSEDVLAHLKALLKTQRLDADEQRRRLIDTKHRCAVQAMANTTPYPIAKTTPYPIANTTPYPMANTAPYPMANVFANPGRHSDRSQARARNYAEKDCRA